MTHLNPHKTKKTCDTCAFFMRDEAGHCCCLYRPEPKVAYPKSYCSKWTRMDWLWTHDIKQ